MGTACVVPSTNGGEGVATLPILAWELEIFFEFIMVCAFFSVLRCEIYFWRGTYLVKMKLRMTAR
jgi:hypothetical protein